MNEKIFPKISKQYFVLNDTLFENGLNEDPQTPCFEGEAGTLELRVTLNGDWLTLGAALECESPSGLSDIGGVLDDDTVVYTVPAALMHGEYIRFHLRGTDSFNIRKTADAVLRIYSSFDAAGELLPPESSAYDDLSASISKLSVKVTQNSQNTETLANDLSEQSKISEAGFCDRDIFLSGIIRAAKITDLSNAFENSDMAKLPPVDMSDITSLAYAFRNSEKLLDVPDLDLPACTTMYECFHNCKSLKHVGKINSPNVRKMYALFRNCGSLETIEEINLSSVDSCNLLFANCFSLKEIRFAGVIPISIDLRSARLSKESVDSALSALADGVTEKILYLGASKLALADEELLSSAAAKGWTVQ